MYKKNNILKKLLEEKYELKRTKKLIFNTFLFNYYF